MQCGPGSNLTVGFGIGSVPSVCLKQWVWLACSSLLCDWMVLTEVTSRPQEACSSSTGYRKRSSGKESGGCETRGSAS